MSQLSKRAEGTDPPASSQATTDARALQKPSMRRKTLAEAGLESDTLQRDAAHDPNVQSARFLKILSAVPLLKSLNMDELTLLCGIVEMQTYDVGDTIVRQGDEGNECFIILSGHCAVRKSDGDGQPEVAVSELRPGNYFGETAIIKNAVRMASVSAKSRCECMVIRRAAFEPILGSFQEILERSQIAYMSRVSSLFSAGKGGVGLFFEEQNGEHTVRRIIPGGSAQIDGTIEVGDVCVAVDGRSALGWSQEALKDHIVGDVHTFVHLTFEPSSRDEKSAYAPFPQHMQYQASLF